MRRHRLRPLWVVGAAASVVLAVPAVAIAQEITLTGPLSPEAAQRRTATLCGSADELVEREVELNQARRLYLRALRTGAADTACAADGLKTLADLAKAADAAAAPALPIVKAKALLAAGFVEEADEELTALLGTNPGATIPRAFGGTTARSRPPRRSLRRATKPRRRRRCAQP